MNAENLNVIHNKDENRFEITLNGHLAEADYRIMGSQIIFTHTGVPDELEGQGIGSKLAQTALDYAREKGLKVVPLCPFIAAYIKRHPEYQDIVSEKYHGR